jgi:hypothetical protein
LPLDILPVLLRYARQEALSGGEDATGVVASALSDALDAAEAQLPPVGLPAARARIASLRRAATALR